MAGGLSPERMSQSNVRESGFRLPLQGGEVEVLRLEPAGALGAGEALVFMHEGLGSLELWREFPRSVVEATTRRAYVWSRRGYGSSDPAHLPRTPDYMHDEGLNVLPAFLDALGIDRPVLVGHSDGASIALIYAGSRSRDDNGPSAVVAIAPHVLVEDRSITGIEAARERYVASDMGERMARYHSDADATFWGWNDIWLSPEFRDWNIEEFLPHITCPVLVVQSEDDPYGTLDQVRRVSDGCEAPVLTSVFPTGGHRPHLVHAKEVAVAIADFLDNASTDPGPLSGAQPQA